MSQFSFEINDNISLTLIWRAVLILFSVFMIAFVFLKKKDVESQSKLPPTVRLPRAAWLWYRSGLPIYEFSRQLKYTLNSSVYMVNILGQKVVFLTDFCSIREAFTNPHLLARPHPKLGPATPVAEIATTGEWDLSFFILRISKWRQGSCNPLKVYPSFNDCNPRSRSRGTIVMIVVCCIWHLSFHKFSIKYFKN